MSKASKKLETAKNEALALYEAILDEDRAVFKRTEGKIRIRRTRGEVVDACNWPYKSHAKWVILREMLKDELDLIDLTGEGKHFTFVTSTADRVAAILTPARGELGTQYHSSTVLKQQCHPIRDEFHLGPGEIEFVMTEYVKPLVRSENRQRFLVHVKVSLLEAGEDEEEEEKKE